MAYRRSVHPTCGQGRVRPMPRGRGTPSIGGSSMSGITSQMSQLTVSNTIEEARRIITAEQAAKIAAEAIDAVPEAQLGEITSLKPKMSFGTVGRPIDLYAKYFNLVVTTGQINVHRYKVEIIRPKSDRKIDKDTNRHVFWRAVEDYPDIFGGIASLIYDGARCLWTSSKLHMDRGQASVEVEADRIRVHLKYASTFTIDVSRDDTVRCLTVQFLDALLTRRLRCPLHELSQFFNPFGGLAYLNARNDTEHRRFNHTIGPGTKAWNGIQGVVKAGAKGQALYNCDVSSSSSAKIRINVLDFYIEILNDGLRNKVSVRDLEDPKVASRITLDERNRRKLKAGLTGLQLCLAYGDEEMRAMHFKFIDVGQPATVLRFMLQEQDDRGNVTNEKEMTVQEYFWTLEWCAYNSSDRMECIQFLADAQRVQECEIVSGYGVEVKPQFVRVAGHDSAELALNCNTCSLSADLSFDDHGGSRYRERSGQSPT